MWFSASVANLLQDLMYYVFRDALLHKSVVTSGDLNFYLTQITNVPGQSVASPGDLLPSELPLAAYFLFFRAFCKL